MNVGIIPLISSIVSFVFAVAVLDQYFARRKPFQLVWAIGLFMYFVATIAEFWLETYGLNSNHIMYRLWYLFGAICTAAYLGMGTVYLFVRRQIAHIVMLVLATVSIYATVAVFTASIDLGSMKYLTGVGVMPQGVRDLSRYFSYVGTVALVGGALYSAWLFWRKHILANRVTSNILIAVGALMPAIAGPIFRAGGLPIYGYFLELAGIIIIFLGFLRTKEVFGFFRFPLVHGFGRIAETRPVTPSKPAKH